jgi:hypothetical protein
MPGTYSTIPPLNNAVVLAVAPFVSPNIGGLPHYRGNGYIAGEAPSGLVTAGGVPAARQLELRHFTTRITIMKITSNSDGTYIFDGLDPTVQFEVIGRDQTGTYGQVIVGPVLPKAH